jgi:hypothetical protein
MKKTTMLIWVLNAVIITLAIGEAKAGWLTHWMGISRDNCIGCHPGTPSAPKPAASPAQAPK